MRGRAHHIGRLSSVRSPRLPYVDEVVDGHRVLELLGQGGMGAVFRAWDERLQRQVAIKMVQPRWVGRPQLRDRFMAEARAMARVRHANVVDVYAFGEFGELPYFAMELLLGRTLEQRIEEDGPAGIPLEERLRILSGVCHGVGAIHQHQMVHGDIKPSNVLLAEDGRVALTDMGLARLLDSPDVEAPGLWGTPAYIAPELTAGEPIPVGLLPLADVYSIGVLAFELLTGRLPFETDDTPEMLELHRTELPPRPSVVYPALHRAFDVVILKALHKDPMQRPQSAAELLSAITRAAERTRASGRHLRFLVADDDRDHRAIVARILAREFPGCVVETCSDGEGALRAAERCPPSLAIVDLAMPGMNGVELTAALRARRDVRGVPVVVLTGEGRGTDWQLLMRLGADRFMVKPFDRGSFVATIKSLVEQDARAA